MVDQPIAMTIYHNPACGTSRNTLALIRNAGIEPTVIEYLKTAPDRDTLKNLIARLRLRPRDLLKGEGNAHMRDSDSARPTGPTSSRSKRCSRIRSSSTAQSLSRPGLHGSAEHRRPCWTFFRFRSAARLTRRTASVCLTSRANAWGALRPRGNEIGSAARRFA